MEEEENTQSCQCGNRQQKVACVVTFHTYVFIYTHTLTQVFHTKDHSNYPSNAMHPVGLYHFQFTKNSDAGTQLTRMESSLSMSSAE